jgi:predicted outer membrane repeat protein
MHGNLARIARGMAAIGITMAASLAAAQLAEAAPAVVDVPCSVSALTAGISGAGSGQTLNLAQACLYRLSTGLPVVGQDLTIMGNGATLQRNYAAGTPAFTILTVDAGTLTVTDLNFKHGNGAIAVTGDGLLTVNGGTFTQNTATDGGAISDITGLDGPTVDGATFTQNSATVRGGAIYDNTALHGPMVTDSTFTRNTAGGGGAIFSFDASGSDLTGSVFQGNSALLGGALLLDSNSDESLSNDVVHGNSATADGGGIYDANGSGLTVNASEISRNQAGGQGGGVYLAPNVKSHLTGTVIKVNSAANGGGIYNPAGGTAFVTNGAIFGNTASVDGGGIYNAGTGASIGFVTLTSSNVSRNAAGTGGGGIFDQITTVTNVTLAGSAVHLNTPDNCEPLGSITGCTG